MKRRNITALMVLALASAGPVFGQTIKDDFVAQLHSQGFKSLSITRTWLGRTRITGSNGKFQRELVFNSSSGEILRDYWKDVSPTSKKEDAKLLTPEDVQNSKSSGESGSGNGSGDNGSGSDGAGSGSDGAGSGGGSDGHGGDGHGG